MVRCRLPAAVARAVLTSLTLVLGACASASTQEPAASATRTVTPSGTQTTPVAPSPSPSPAPAPAAREIVVDVSGGVITPPPANIEVSVDERLRVVVTSDAPDEVHIHGVDVTGPVGPGAPFEAEVVPAQTGVFEVELHRSGALLFQLLVR
jgi:hypothetical protein